MGNSDSKLNFRRAIVQLAHNDQLIEADDEFWDQFWKSGYQISVDEVFTLITTAEIRKIRDDNPVNLATLCYKAVEKLAQAVDNSCRSVADQQCVLNCVRLLIRIIPHIFEDGKWRDFFWSSLPAPDGRGDAQNSLPLAKSLLNATCDLLFCPDFTVSTAQRRGGPEKAEELVNIDSCEYIWEAGVGFAQTPPRNAHMERRRTELLKLLLVCLSEPMYRAPNDEIEEPSKWIVYFTSAENRHALPLFTSFINTICAYDPVGYGVPYNHLLFSDTTEPLVEACLQLLIVTLDYDAVTQLRLQKPISQKQEGVNAGVIDDGCSDNLFINYLSRLHREEDFQFILSGITRLLNNPLSQNYLPNSTKRLHCHQELLILFWKICDYNKKFLYFTLKSSDVLNVLIPILYHLNNSRADQSRVGLMHIGVFILLLLSGERSFGVRLNKPYSATVPMDIPVFTGTHADLLITVFHKIIATGHQRLQPLFDCLLTILVNVSPYLKTLSMVASVKLLHLLEAFSTPWFLISAPNNHHLVFFLLEAFNNIIQYQFDGNSNLVYTIIRKRHIFHSMANLPTDVNSIAKCLSGRKVGSRFNLPRIRQKSLEPDVFPATQSVSADNENDEDDNESDVESQKKQQQQQQTTDENSPHEAEDQPVALFKATLLDTPGISQMTEAHTNFQERSKYDDVTIAAAEDRGSQPESPRATTSVACRNNVRYTSDELDGECWYPTPEWIVSWRSKLPLQTVMRLLQVLVPQVEKICIDKGLTDESEILKFLQHGTLVGLLPVPHPILIRKYQANPGTTAWFRTYIWGVIYLRNVDPAIWYDTDVKLFEIQKM